MSKIKNKLIVGYQSTLSENINEWLELNPSVYIVDTCGVGPFGSDHLVGVSIFYGLKTKAPPPIRENPNEDPKCPKCHRVMVIRSSNKTGELFWGCPRYPDCVSSVPFTEEDFNRKYPPSDTPNKVEEPPKNPEDNDDIPF